MIDHYQVLGIRRDATHLTIKRAYRRLAKKHHPDRNPGDPSAEERFKPINAAYEVLGDEDERRRYDLELLGLEGGTPAVGPVPEPSGATATEFELADGVLGSLLALCFAMAAAAPSAAPAIASIALVALVAGWLLAHRGGVPPLLVLTALGAVGAGWLRPTAARALVDSSGWLYAVAGGMASGLVGAGFGRICRGGWGSVAGAIFAAVIGAALGAGVSGFLWYWGAVFRWTRAPIPPDESLSLVASAGVIGSALGGALAALAGTLRARR